MPLKIDDNIVILVNDKGEEKEIATIGDDNHVEFVSAHYKRTYKDETAELLKGWPQETPAGTEDQPSQDMDSGDETASPEATAAPEDETTPAIEQAEAVADALPAMGGDLMEEEPLPPHPSEHKHFGMYTKEWLLWDAFNSQKEAFVMKWGAMHGRNKKHYEAMHAWAVASEFGERFKAILKQWRF